MVINERGLDPCVGFLHTPLPGRESFAIDLIEPLRSGADAFVISLLDNHMFDENEFAKTALINMRCYEKNNNYINTDFYSVYKISLAIEIKKVTRFFKS
jgi:Uncharacterized protein predicted to be involved in DNA repair